MEEESEKKLTLGERGGKIFFSAFVSYYWNIYWQILNQSSQSTDYFAYKSKWETISSSFILNHEISQTVFSQHCAEEEVEVIRQVGIWLLSKATPNTVFLFSLFRLFRQMQYFNSLNNYLLITISVCLRVNTRHLLC